MGVIHIYYFWLTERNWNLLKHYISEDSGRVTLSRKDKKVEEIFIFISSLYIKWVNAL